MKIFSMNYAKEKSKQLVQSKKMKLQSCCTWGC